jgi:O-antigen/teichoic acid export membrane protein
MFDKNAAPDPRNRPDSPIRRAVRNAAWLMAGKGTGGVFSLIYIGLAARSLGVQDFGIFAVILAYGQAIANLAQFQSWQTVVRYGAVHHVADQPAKLQRILYFTSLLDAGSATVGAIAGVIGALLIGPYFGWSGDESVMAALFSLSLLFGLRGTPTGILRLFDRFDLAAYAETVLPAMRLVGALMAWVTQSSILGYLIAWSAAELITTAAIWWAAIREINRQGLQARGRDRIRGVVEENPGLWKFAWNTNFNFSLSLIWKQLPILVVGWAVSPAIAGGFRIAANLVSALNKPAQMLARAMYPELARLAVTDRGQVERIVNKSTVIAGFTGLGAVLLMTALGDNALVLIGGEEYAFAYPYLMLLAIAAAIELCGVAVEPAMIAFGRPGKVLEVRAATGLFYTILLVWMTIGFEGVGAAGATVFGAIFLFIALYALFLRTVRRARRKAAAA